MKAPEITPANVHLLRSLSFFTTVMLIVGGVIGSGIFRKPGVMAAELGSPTVLLAVWLIAGIITLFGALTNAEVAAAIPKTGGQFIFFERMYGAFPAFLYGWSMFAVVQCGSIAALAYVFAEYATQFVDLPHGPANFADWAIPIPWLGSITPLRDLGVKGLAAALILGLTLANLVGVRFGGRIQNLTTVAKLVAMVGIVALVVVSGKPQLTNLQTDSTTIAPEGLLWWLAIAAALQGAFWAYDGWNNVTFVAGEVRNPQRTLPRSLFIGIMLVTFAYMLLNVAYCAVLSIDEMAASKLVASDVAERCVSGGGRLIAAAVLLSTFGAANATILASARIYFAMAQRGVFPQPFAKIHPRFSTPSVSLWIQCAWSIALVFSGTFDTLTDTLIFVTWVFYAAGAIGLFVLRWREPDLPRAYRVPLYPWIPLAFIVFAIAFLVMTLWNDISHYASAQANGEPALLNCGMGTVLVLAGTPIYFMCRRAETQTRRL